MRATSVLVLLALVGCNGDATFTKRNNEPVAKITSPSDGDSAQEGFVTTFRGTISDTNDGPEELVATWLSGAVTLCAEAPVELDGSTLCEAALGIDDTEILLEGRDPDNATGQDTVTLNIIPTDAPTARITGPDASNPLYEGTPVQFDAVVEDGEDAATDLIVEWTDTDGSVLTIDEAADADGNLSGSTLLDVGDHTITLTVTDSTGKTGSATIDLTVGGANSGPSCEILTPADGGNAGEGDTVSLSGLVTDPDVDGTLLSAAWSSDIDGDIGTSDVESDGSTALDVSTLSYGTHVLTLTGTDDGGLTCSDTVTFSIGTPPDVVIDLPTDGEFVNEGDTVTFAATVADDSTAPDALELSWVSDVDGVLDTNPADAAGTATFDAAWLSAGDHTITLTVTDSDGLYAVATSHLTVNGLPTAPTIRISPTPADTDDDLVVAIDADAVDPEGDPLVYAYAWTVDGAATAYTGTTVPASATTRDEVWEVTVTANDGYGEGLAGVASVTVGNSPPSLASATLDPDPAVEGDTLTCTPGSSSDADGDSVSYTYAWTVNGLAIAPTASSINDTWWTGGDQVACVVTPTDGTDDGASVTSNVVTIGNSPPSISGVEISPSEPLVSDTLTCSTTGWSDADGDSDQTTYEWSVNGTVVGSGDTLSGAFAIGDTVTCTATPFDGTDSGAPMSVNVEIANALPVLASVVLTPLSPSDTDTLTCTPGTTTDADGTTSFTYTYAWTVNGASIGVTTATLDPSYFGRGESVRCIVTPNDGVEDGSPVASNAVSVGNTAPEVSSVTIAPDPAVTDDVLVATVSSSDADGDTVSLDYAWYVNGSLLPTTTATLDGDSWFDAFDTVELEVTPDDGFSTGLPVRSNTVSVENSAPDVASVSLTPLSPSISSTLTCSPTASDADGDTLTYTYAWYVDGVVAAATGSTLSSSYFASGDAVYCRVTADDGTDTDTTTSNTVTIGNTAPVLSSVALTPTTAYESSTLTCTASATDADGDSVSYTYAWYVNSSAVAATSSTLTGTYFSKGDNVYCRATPTDGTTAGTAGSSNTVTISNSTPAMSSVSLTPTTAYEASTLTCSASGTDADSDTLSYAYTWYVNGSSVAASSSTLTGTYFGRGDSVYCSVTPSDGTATGSALASSTVTISNTAPVLSAVALTPASPSISDTLTCTPTASDADGDTISYSYAWYVDGAAVAATTSTLTSTYFSSGDSIYCRVTPSDASGSGTAMSSSSVTVGNTAPVLSSVSLSPTTAYESSTLTCSASATDADGDTVTFTYAWYVNSSAIAATSSTLTGTYFSKGDSVYCRATPTDGTTAGTAGSSNTVSISNSTPAMSSVSLTPTTAYEASTLTCSASGTDGDGDTLSYSYTWYVNSSAVAATGTTLTGSYFGRGDVVYCSVAPYDGTVTGSALASSTVTISNTLPVLSSVAVTPSSPTESDTLTCTPTATDADSDTISYAYAWYVDSVAVASTSATLSSAYFGSGDSVYCRVTPSDSSGAGTAMSSSAVTVSNTAPVISSVSLTPTTAYESSTLTCSASATDADGDTVTFTYAWYVNSSAIAATSSTLTGTYFAKGDSVYCRATPSDGSTSGTAGSSNTVTISNSTPAMSSVSLTPTTAYEASTLTCTASGTDGDGDTLSYNYTWYVNSSVVAASGSTLTGTYFGRGNTVYCSVTPSDGTATGTALASSTVTISNTLPVLSAVTLTPASPSASDTLTCTPTATDADSDTISYTYAWYVNSSAVAATSSTLTSTYFGGGDSVYCRVTPADSSGSGTAMSSSAVTVSNSAPVISSVTLTPTTAYEASTLTCSASGSDADGDTVSYTYAWYVNSSAIAATSSTLTGTYFGKNDVVYCRATPSDGTVSGTAVSSNTVTISNTVPVLSSVSVTPTTAYEASTLTCTPSATDADSDSISYTYAWTVNGSAVAATTSTLTGTYFSRGNTVICTVTPGDGTGAGTAMASSSVTISNTAPVLSAVSLTPTTAYESSTLTCSPTSSDADADTVSYTYAWYVNSTAIAATSSTLTGTYFSSGNTVYCRATPTDGTTSGTAMSSSIVTISNTAPVVSSVSLTPTTAYEASTLTCTPTTTDADGTTSFTYTYAWYVNGSAIAATSSTLTGTYFSKSNTVYCTATASDGSSSSSATSSNTVTISNTAPVTSSVSLTPTTAYETSTLTCSPTSSDADGDTVSYTYAWYVNSSAVAATSSTLTGTYFSKGNTVYCRATPTDGTTSGTAVSSSTVTISNSTPSAPTVTISPDLPEAGVDPIVCTVTTSSTDADSDTLTYTFTWTRNGTSYTGATNTSTTSTVPYTATSDGDVWICSATASDGTATSSAGTDTIDVLGALYYAGYYTAYTTNATLGGNYLFAEKVTLSSAADLYTMGYIARSVNTASFLVGLYSNNSGAPGTLLGSAAAFTPTGNVEVDITTAPVALSAGDYWMVWITSANAYAYYSNTCSSVTTYYKSYTYGTLPTTWPSGASTLTGQCHNIYVGLR